MRVDYHTYREIMQQPVVWLREYDLLLEKRKEIEAFVSKYIEAGYEVIFTGAGTSAYIGDILEVSLSGTPLRGARSVPTTDLVTNPEYYLSPEKKVLMISFARSGDSPESLGAIKLANSICKDIAHIYVTCNAGGHLARTAADSPSTLLLLLPPETNDQSLAMTSSFSTMLFAGITIANIRSIEAQLPVVTSLVKRSVDTLARLDRYIPEIASRRFDRAVFLGSGELKGIAKESHLKLQELTDGGVVCSYDSFLGFRHGPKAVVNGNTLMVYLLSGDPDVRRYEADLIRQLNTNNRVVAQIAVSERNENIPGVDFDLEVELGGGGGEHLKNLYRCIPYIFVSQLLGFYKSLDLGLNPDSPSVSGNISRVVTGVTIY